MRNARRSLLPSRHDSTPSLARYLHHTAQVLLCCEAEIGQSKEWKSLGIYWEYTTHEMSVLETVLAQSLLFREDRKP